MVELSSGVIAILIVAFILCIFFAIDYGYRLGWKIKHDALIKWQESMAEGRDAIDNVIKAHREDVRRRPDW